MNLLQKTLSLFGQKNLTPSNPGAFYRFLFQSSVSGTYSNESLAMLYRKNELAFACINKIADVMNDAEIVVEKLNNKGEYERLIGHPMVGLIKRPNVEEVGSDLRRKVIQSENSLGIVYFHLIRPRPNAVPIAVYVLNPNRVFPQVNYSNGTIDYFRYSTALGKQIDISPEDILIKRRTDLTDEFGGLAPLSVAANTISGDENLTDYVNSFLDPSGGGGVPAGILKFNATLSPEMARLKKEMWNKNTRGDQIAVLDANAEFQPIGSKLSELNSGDLREQNESRICSVFGVPPILVGAYVGIKNTTANATAKSALKDFGINKISPELKVLREWLTWNLLAQFEDENEIKAEKIRVNFDLSQMVAFQEDLDAIHNRARTNFSAGGWTLNEFREATGKLPDKKGDYYLQPFNLNAVSPESRAAQAVRKIEQGTNPEEEITEETDKKAMATAQPTSSPKLLPEKKTVEFEGLTLSREPSEIEKLIGLKSLSDELFGETELLQNSLLKYRDALINQAVSAAKDLEAATVHGLTLVRNEKLAKQINKTLGASYQIGRKQIIREINLQKSQKSLSLPETKDLLDDEIEERIGEVSDSVLAKILNEIQSRAINIYTALKLLGWDASEFFDELKKRLFGESAKFVEQLANNSANLVIQIGRKDEILNYDGDGETEYSAILDKNICDNCKPFDGKRSKTPDKDLPDVPNRNCLGGSNCRCFWVIILD